MNRKKDYTIQKEQKDYTISKEQCKVSGYICKLFLDHLMIHKALFHLLLQVIIFPYVPREIKNY